MNSDTTSTDFRPTASWENLRLRAELLRRLRSFFDSRGFLEVETPILSADTVVDRHLDPFYTEVAGDCGRLRRLWLQTSPEFAMKRLLAAGGGPIFQVARVFRLDEIGPLHNPEFTLVEWYQPGQQLTDGMQFTSDLYEAMVRSSHRRAAFPSGPAEAVSYREAFERYVGIDPHAADGEKLAATARDLGIEVPASLKPQDRDGWLDLLLVERIQPHLGVERPTLLYDYPATQAALARVRSGTPPIAERFELYVAGIELANGYYELLDPAELRARNARVNAQRSADGKPALPEESRLLAAMAAGLPPAVGVALGFDRLVMLAAGAKCLSDVITFPSDRA